MCLCITAASAADNINETVEITDENTISHANDGPIYQDTSSNLENEINNADNGDEIVIEPGTYKIHNVEITKNITLQGNGDPRDVIIDGEKKSSIFLIRSPDVHVTFKNITFINGETDNFGGAISNEEGHMTVDNCIFINNTALKNTNAGGISNYGTKSNRGYLLINNSLFINNRADHDGGAITTCYADSFIYNCVFIDNYARRDGGAIRVSVYGYGYVEDCIFMFNHADEWGGAYYSWSGESDIRSCIFMNNTAGTNGGAVMVSGNINLQDSIIVNNDGGETGGSFYIQQPMYDAKTVINVHDNIITNNTSPLGKEVFIKWDDTHNLYTQFNNNDWGDEDPNDSSVNDPNNVTSRIKVSKTIKSNLFSRLNLNLLDKYSDLLGSYFPDDSLENLKNQFKSDENSNKNTNAPKTSMKSDIKSSVKSDDSNKKEETSTAKTAESLQTSTRNLNSQIIAGNSTSHGEDEKAYELNETGGSAAKQITSNIPYIIATFIIAMILLLIGYKRQKRSK